MTDAPKPSADQPDANRFEEQAYDLLMRGVFRSQFIAALTVGLVCVVTAVVIARLLTHADIQEIKADNQELKGNIQELKSLVQSNKCQCEARNVTADASGNRVVIAPDQNSMGQLTREVLRKQGDIQ